ncbi:hypothetical protein [Candidatus Electronema sp. JC]|uniref:hypothetical protein n=1 Tax=Candidatus Electronema sp. JC TaxID=3401570 RepID=UPI003B437D3F
MNVSKNYLFLVCLFVISLPLSGCNQENQKLQAENAALRSKLQTLESELAKQPRELDRKAAEEILNKYLSAPSKKDIKFTEEGFQLAKVDGVISENPSREALRAMASPWIFSKKGIVIFGSLLNKDDIEFQGKYSTFKSNLAENVVSIEEITDGPYPGTKVVQFITNYVFPPDVKQEIVKYVYLGKMTKALFRRYDDGWRVEE